MSTEILVLGAENSGKSLLLRRLREHFTEEKDGHINSTVPTVGVDVITLCVDKIEISFREVGGAMSSRWDTYVTDCSCLMYVVDASDNGSWCTSYVLLLELLSLPAIEGKMILLILNKLDICSDDQLVSLRSWMHIDQLKRSFSENFFEFCGYSVSHQLTLQDDKSSTRLGRSIASFFSPPPVVCSRNKSTLLNDLVTWMQEIYIPKYCVDKFSSSSSMMKSMLSSSLIS